MTHVSRGLPETIRLVLLLLSAAAACKVDEDCSLNGICSTATATCSCNKGWKGESCALLNRQPQASRAAAAVYGMHPNVTSWGGNVLVDNSTGLHHLYVTEIAGANCGLVSWGSHSTIIHAVSENGMGGPFEKKSVVVNVEGHNPQTIRYKGNWVIFHIGGGSAPGKPVKPCPGPPPPACTAYKTRATCPSARCEWKDGSCTAPPPPPTPPALCATQDKVDGYSCKGDTCGGPKPRPGGHNCGPYITVPTLSCKSNCATELAALCDKDPKCHSFSLENKYGGSGALHSQTFAGGNESLATNNDWSTWVKHDNAKEKEMGTEEDEEAHRSRYSGFPSSGPSYTGSKIHMSSSPEGPFEPVTTSFPSCYNPSPWVMDNGTIVVLCRTWHVLAADSLEGPWRSIPGIAIHPSTRMNTSAAWEDPFLWQDVNHHWHALSHTYTHQPGGPSVQNSISGHLFARSVEGPWTVSPIEPYDSHLAYADGTEETFSTMERPKLMFDSEGNPTHITNGVSPVYPCNTCKGFGDAPPQGGCCWCKVTPGEDWTYTVIQSLGN